MEAVQVVRKADLVGTARHVQREAYETYRFLLASDNIGLTLTDIVLVPGIEAIYGYNHHVEVAYYITGDATLTDVSTGVSQRILPGTLWVAPRSARFRFLAHVSTRLICVFRPPFIGHETGFAGDQ
jgi:L-ectoine synthase